MTTVHLDSDQAPVDSPRVLMIAYHFPPMSSSSGIQRTLNFVRDLPALGWVPAVLTAHCRAYEKTSVATLQDIPGNTTVRRAFALDSARHLALFGRYPLSIALPDRWITWGLGAIPTGLTMIRQFKPAILWSTYPIATAHLIGYRLARLSGLPWVADFRDPMAHQGYPTDRRTWLSFLRIEKKVFSRADRIVFATTGAARLYRKRYPEAADRIRVIENGYDEKAFLRAAKELPKGPLNPGATTLLHSGIVYPAWRNPEHLFQALRNLIDRGAITASTFRLRFRASEHDSFILQLIKRYELDAIVELSPQISYLDALAEMLRADGLLVLQSHDCNDQVPAKLYEYFRAGRPIIGLADPAGDTAEALRQAGLRHVAPLESADAIEKILISFLTGLAAGTAPVATQNAITATSRRGRANQLANLFNEIVH